MENTTKNRTKTSNKPVKVFRAPHGLSASVFDNHVERDGKQTSFYKTALQRSYKDDDGNFKTTSTLSRDELLAAAHLLTQAYAYVIAAEREEAEE